MMAIMKDILPLIIHVAPIISTALTGNPLSGVVTTLIAHAIGADMENPESIAEKIKNDPEALDKIKALEESHGSLIKALIPFKAPKKISIVFEWENEFSD